MHYRFINNCSIINYYLHNEYMIIGSPILLTAPQSAPSSAPVSATSTPQAGTRRILPQPKAQQHITLYAPPHSAQTTPTRTPIQLHSTKRPAPLGISIPASIVSAAEPSNQQKRTASQVGVRIMFSRSI